MKKTLKGVISTIIAITILTTLIYGNNVNFKENNNSEIEILNWQNNFNGETSTTFYYEKTNMNLRYSLTNTGNGKFQWTILDPSGEKWAKGTLNSGETKTYIAFNDLDYMPKGRYTLRIVTDDGGQGSAEVLVNITD
ncbi:MAG: hypothetical protein K2F59_02550 [Eubacteriales bacterium]|nr:hypothetical protein [Eubacteriales bacterium]